MERKIASPIKRLGGYIIDWLICVGPLAYYMYAVANSGNVYRGLDGAMIGLTIAMTWSVADSLFNAYLTSKLGGTIGKIVMNTKVVDSDGHLISFYKALFRNYIGYMVSATVAFLGFIWILVDKKNHRAWHDLIADTYVVSMK